MASSRFLRSVISFFALVSNF
ncbi:BnaC02g00630D [Brassica napus]|uniref:BnaC02g00630D protein n=1 Tax=Brassica napus TaxID=3708 RepID=A0A078HQI2_BRANA|nr:BnaC02g00630D [Brassica napus]